MQTSPTAFRLGYRRWLDGLRGVAILMVLTFHWRLSAAGFLGVDVFFVLSGFLITSLLVEEWQGRGSIHLGRFYLRRCLRLLPAFLLLLLLGWLWTIYCRPWELGGYRKEMVVAACYVTNWMMLHQTPMPTLAHTWSLSVEEQFYVLWPILLYCMLRWRLSRPRILWVVSLGVIGSAGLRLLLHRLQWAQGSGTIMQLMRLYAGLDTRADALLVGCLVGLVAASGLLPRWRGFLFWSGAAALLAVAGLLYLVCTTDLFKPQYFDGLFTVVALLVALLLVRLLVAPCRLASWILEFPPLVGIGRISYGLYLFHIPVGRWLQPAGLGWQFPRETLQVAGISLGLALLSYFGVERPLLRLKARLQFAAPPRQRTAPVGILGEAPDQPQARAA